MSEFNRFKKFKKFSKEIATLKKQGFLFIFSSHNSKQKKTTNKQIKSKKEICKNNPTLFYT